MYQIPKSMTRTTMPSRSHSWISLTMTLLLLSGRSVVAQDAGVSNAVGILNAAIGFRGAVLRDSTLLETCSAFAVLGRPADFPAKLNPYVVQLLNRETNTCDQPAANRTNMWCSLVRLQKLAIADSTATLELTVSRSDFTHREVYTVIQSPGSRWGVRSVTLSGFMQVLWGANSGDVGPNGPICPHRE